MFVMMDQSRLLLYNRYTRNIQNEVNREQFQITLYVVFITWVMSFFTLFIENTYNYARGEHGYIGSFFDMFFFMMTTLSTVGYGSSIVSPVGRISIIIFLVIVVTTVPD